MEKNFNKVFRTPNGVIFNKINANEAESFKGNYIAVIDGKAVAVQDGKSVAMPPVLLNEIGVAYHFVDYAAHGKDMAKKHGIYTARKQEPIRVWWDVKPGEKVQTVIDGYVEHEVELDESKVAVQNVIKNEFYAMPKEVLNTKYQFSHKEFDHEVWVPKSDAVSHWVYSDINTYGVLWGGFEFLTTPMINITNENDVYGCNYIVFWGNDGRLASYVVLQYIAPEEQKYYDGYSAVPHAVVDAPYNPPRC